MIVVLPFHSPSLRKDQIHILYWTISFVLLLWSLILTAKWLGKFFIEEIFWSTKNLRTVDITLLLLVECSILNGQPKLMGLKEMLQVSSGYIVITRNYVYIYTYIYMSHYSFFLCRLFCNLDVLLLKGAYKSNFHKYKKKNILFRYTYWKLFFAFIYHEFKKFLCFLLLFWIISLCFICYAIIPRFIMLLLLLLHSNRAIIF